METEQQKVIRELIEKNERRRIIIDLLNSGKTAFDYEDIKEIILKPESNKN